MRPKSAESGAPCVGGFAEVFLAATILWSVRSQTGGKGSAVPATADIFIDNDHEDAWDGTVGTGCTGGGRKVTEAGNIIALQAHG